jgi:CheY-like chemotaxis protein
MLASTDLTHSKPMSWVTVVWSMIAATRLTLASVHGVVWWWRRDAWANLLFALTALAPARVLLADDHPAILAMVASVMDGQCEVVDAVADGAALLAAASRLDPDLIILDIAMPQVDGLDAARQLRLNHTRTRLVFLTVHEDADFARAAFATAALGFVIKPRLASDLMPAVRAALAGKRFLSSTVHLDETV